MREPSQRRGEVREAPPSPRLSPGVALGNDPSVPTEAQLLGARILMVDDEPVNLQLLRRLLERAGYTRLVETTDPRQVASLFSGFQPDLVLLDLHMPGMDGYDVLAQLTPLIPRSSYLPMLMLTADSTPAAKQRALSLGARDFVIKPFVPDEVLLRIRNLLVPRFLHLELKSQNQILEKRVRQRTRALEQTRLEVLERLARAAEYRDDATGDHTRRVGRTAAFLADSLGADQHYVDLISRAAPLHDIGKIGVPDHLLLKPAKLEADEYEVMKRHARIGADILSGGRSAVMQLAEEVALDHHERWDGTGYPAGLAGEAIPVAARIVAIADVFDALTHDRPYRKAWPLPRALAEIEAGAGSHFDPSLTTRFLKLPHRELM